MKTLNICSSLAILLIVTLACWMAGEAMVLAGPTPGALMTALMGLACGSAWPHIFSKDDAKAEGGVIWLVASFVFFLLSYLFSHWQIWLDNVLMFQ